jgi:hypothetical protein
MMRESDRQHRELAELSARQVGGSREISLRRRKRPWRQLRRVPGGGFLETARSEIEAPDDENADSAETVRRDLDRIFNTGGVAGLVGSTYGAAKDVGVYVTGEAIRGLADLEAK